MSEKTDKILVELGYSPAKTKTPQPVTPDQVQNRDLFQTPNYAVDLLVPYIPSRIKWIWECAAGSGKIVNRLRRHGYNVIGSDLKGFEGPQLILLSCYSLPRRTLRELDYPTA